MIRTLRNITIEAWLPLLLVALWWVTSASSESLYFPPLSRIVARFAELWLFELVPVHLVPSLINLGAGLGIGLAAALVLGVILGLTPSARDAVAPLLEFMRAMPILALLPLIVALLGLGVTSKVAIIALSAFWPTLLNTIDGVLGTHPQAREVARSYRLRRHELIRRVVLPSAMPQIMVGVRTSVSVAVVVMVGSELFGATEGIGYFVLQAQRTYAVVDMWTGLILLGLVGYGLNLLSEMVERRVLSWHRGLREGSEQTKSPQLKEAK